MSYSARPDLCQLPTVPASTEKYKQLVYDSTAQLVQPIQSILSALDLRAKALSNCASFESALRDANIMQQLSSSSAVGYLREAMIYSEQGKQRHVSEICNKALRVVDTKDPSYDTLQRVKANALTLSANFLSTLLLQHSFQCSCPMILLLHPIHASTLQVSNQWRHRIIQSVDGLSFSMSEDDSG